MSDYLFTLSKCKSADKDALIPDWTNTVGVRAFAGKTTLESVVFEEGPRGLDEEAFASCQNLAKLELPSTLWRIGKGCFKHCNALTALELLEETSTIEE